MQIYTPTQPQLFYIIKILLEIVTIVLKIDGETANEISISDIIFENLCVYVSYVSKNSYTMYLSTIHAGIISNIENLILILW